MPKFHERIVKLPEFRRAMRKEFFFLRNPHDVTQALDRVHRACRFEKAGARRQDHANIMRKSCEGIAKFIEFRRALRKKNFVHSASFRFKKSRNVAAALSKVRILFISEKVRV